MNFFDKFQAGLEKIVGPFATAVANSKHIKALTEGFMHTMPITLGVAKNCHRFVFRNFIVKICKDYNDLSFTEGGLFMKIIMRADDLGISEAVNYGIYKAIVKGPISCVGMMPNMETAVHGYQIIKDLDVCLGQHTNISLGKPLTDPLKIPSLVNEKGEFYSSKEINRREKDTISILECEIEVEAQLKRFIEITGETPEYLEGHAVFSANYMKALENVAEKYHLFYENPLDSKWSETFGITGLDFQTLDEKGLYDPYQYFKDNLDNIRKNKCSLAVFHPGYIDQFLLDHSSYTFIRPMECAFLCSDWLKTFIETYSIKIVNFNNYK